MGLVARRWYESGLRYVAAGITLSEPRFGGIFEIMETFIGKNFTGLDYSITGVATSRHSEHIALSPRTYPLVIPSKARNLGVFD